MTRYALFVTGAPATGKSSIAEGLARVLPDFALLQKDLLKEALFEVWHEDEGEAASQRRSAVAMELLWAVARYCPRVILEANFRTAEAHERERFQALDAQKLEVHCSCRPETAMRRFAARAASRHPAHTLKDLSWEVYQDSQAPFGLGPLIELDTTNAIDLERLAAQVRAHWPRL